MYYWNLKFNLPQLKNFFLILVCFFLVNLFTIVFSPQNVNLEYFFFPSWSLRLSLWNTSRIWMSFPFFISLIQSFIKWLLYVPNWSSNLSSFLRYLSNLWLFWISYGIKSDFLDRTIMVLSWFGIVIIGG